MKENIKTWQICNSPEETINAAKKIAENLPKDCTIALHGGLGVGKTTFVQGIAKAFEINEAITSPSYNIYTIYKGKKRQLIHMDAYRLPSSEAVEGLMIEEFMTSPWCWIVEWPEKIKNYLPEDTIHIDFEILSNGVHQFKIR